MSIQTIKYFEVGDCYDTEGRGPYKAIANFTTRVSATAYAKKKGNYGSDAKIKEKVIIIAETVGEMNEVKDAEAFQAVLKKLSPQEQEILQNRGLELQ